MRNDLTDYKFDNLPKYLKINPVPYRATSVNEPFQVISINGDIQYGEAGDFLVIGILGDRYIVKRDEFFKYYMPCPN